jgi:hypothetical protein
VVVGCFVLCLFVVVFGVSVHKQVEAACGYLCLAFALFLCFSGCEVVLARVTSFAVFCIVGC